MNHDAITPMLLLVHEDASHLPKLVLNFIMYVEMNTMVVQGTSGYSTLLY